MDYGKFQYEQQRKERSAGETGHRGADQQRHPRHLADHADIVRVPQEPVRAGPDQRRARQHEHPVGPARAERRDRPVLECLRREQQGRARSRRRPRRARRRQAFERHRDECARVGPAHGAVGRVRRLDGAAREQGALVRARQAQLAEHHGDDRDEGDENDDEL